MPQKVIISYKRNAHQSLFHDDIESKFLHLSCGFGGGKSYGLVMKSFQLSRLNRGIPGGCVVPTIADYKKDLLPIYEEVLDLHKVRYRYHKTDKWFQFPWSHAKMYVVSAEKRIRGPNWGWCVINESTLITHERYKEAIGRVRVKGASNPQIASSGTPEGIGHWKEEIFIENPLPRSRIIFGDTRDNLENLDSDFIRTLESAYDPIMLDAYLRGLFINMRGSRFYYAYDPSRNDVKGLEAIPGAEIHVSLDYNVAPMVATLWNIEAVKDADVPRLDPLTRQPILRARAFGEIVIDDGADTNRMCDAFAARGLHPETTIIYPDPAGRARSTQGPPDNLILKQRGWHRIRVKTVAPSFRKRQLAVNNLFAKGLILINPETAKRLKKDCEAVEQDRATLEKVKSNPKLTHASDGMDYMTDILFPLSGEKPESRSIKIR